MRKLIKALAISGGILCAGVLGYRPIDNLLQGARLAIVVPEAHANMYISEAARNLQEGYKPYSLYHLEAALGKKPEINNEARLEDITRAADKLVDRYAKKKTCRSSLLSLAQAIQEEQALESARDTLKTDLEKTFVYDKSAAYHLWLVYNLSLKKTHSVEGTHKEVRDYYRKGDAFCYTIVDSLLNHVEQEMPKGDSELVKKINSYSKNY